MTRRWPTTLRIASATLVPAAALLAASAAWAQQAAPVPPAAAPATAAPAATAPGTAAAPAAAATPPTTPLTAPSLAGSLAANPTPAKFEAGPIGTVYVTGVGSGLLLFQSNPTSADRHTQIDISNGQVIVQKIDGPVQFYAEAGAYSLPSLGTTYFRAGDANSDFYGPLPEGYIKIVPTDTFSVQAGKLPSLIGSETTFTFQNLNIERGLLWNQEPAISRGVQGNLTLGPVALSLSYNDGFYSNRYNWISGSAAYTIDSSNTVSVVGGGNLGSSGTSTLATPFFQNNGSVINLIYTYSSAPWTINPYVQYTDVPSNGRLGIMHGASTYGGALLVDYAFSPVFNLAGRAEYITSTGSVADGAPSLLYGPGSSAWSLTLTPTYQQGIFFLRGEASFVKADSTTAGFAFGRSGTSTTQGRLLVETGVMF